jgi:catechol 2,3-dioxygenase-like lactoylglutathione lyase family enzyme
MRSTADLSEDIMIDHLGLAVSDLERSRTFYTAALKPLGYAPVGVVKACGLVDAIAGT